MSQPRTCLRAKFSYANRDYLNEELCHYNSLCPQMGAGRDSSVPADGGVSSTALPEQNASTYPLSKPTKTNCLPIYTIYLQIRYFLLKQERTNIL